MATAPDSELNDLILSQLVTMIEGGMEVEDIAEELDTSPKTIYRWAEYHLPGLLQRVRSARDMEVAEAYASTNRTVQDIAMEFGISIPTLYSVLHRTGTPKRYSADNPNSYRHPDTRQAIIDDYQGNTTINAIRLKYGISTSTIYVILDEEGIPRRRQWSTVEGSEALIEQEPGVVILRRPGTSGGGDEGV